MTRREWMLENYPHRVSKEYGGTSGGYPSGGCAGCPSDYNVPGATEKYTSYGDLDCSGDCDICWNAEIRENKKEDK